MRLEQPASAERRMTSEVPEAVSRAPIARERIGLRVCSMTRFAAGVTV
jgi:hypothetical protein